MIRTDKIQTGLFGGVGFRQPTLTGYNIVDETNQGSTSGLYFGDSSELVTIKNIKDCQEDSDISDVNFNTLLTNMQKSVILDVCNKVIAGQSDFIYTSNLYPYEKSFKNTINPSSKFVGFEITPRQDCYVSSIPFVELCFDSIKTFNLYLYNSNKPKTPVQTKPVTTVAGESTIVILDWILADDTSYKGGTFYLGYFEDDLDGAKAYKRDHEESIFQVSTHYYSVEPCTLDYSGTTIDVTTRVYKSDTFGLNIGMNVYTDYTELILSNRNLFYQAIQLQMHEKILSLIKHSTRSNFTERTLKDIDLELFGNSKFSIDGTIDKLNRAISQIQKALFYVPKITRATLKI